MINGNEEVLHIPQNSRIEASPSHGLVSYPGHSLVRGYPYTEMQSLYSIIFIHQNNFIFVYQNKFFSVY